MHRYDWERERSETRRAHEADVASLRAELTSLRAKHAAERTQLAGSAAVDLAAARESAVRERASLTQESEGVKSAAHKDLVLQREAWMRERSALISAAAAAEVAAAGELLAVQGGWERRMAEARKDLEAAAETWQEEHKKLVAETDERLKLDVEAVREHAAAELAAAQATVGLYKLNSVYP